MQNKFLFNKINKRTGINIKLINTQQTHNKIKTNLDTNQKESTNSTKI